MKRIITALLLVFTLNTAWALDIQQAKAQGLVGEANNGYIAAVQQPASAEVRKLIADVNAKRRSQFQRTAKSNNISVEQVSNRFYELAVEKTRPGHYYQDRGGRWKKK